jgi:hypothetical protein
MDSTANREGRVDHFVVDDGRLKLSHMDVNLTKACRELIPADGAREDITRHERHADGGNIRGTTRDVDCVRSAGGRRHRIFDGCRVTRGPLARFGARDVLGP